jgi:hypothetical protein
MLGGLDQLWIQSFVPEILRELGHFVVVTLAAEFGFAVAVLSVLFVVAFGGFTVRFSERVVGALLAIWAVICWLFSG